MMAGQGAAPGIQAANAHHRHRAHGERQAQFQKMLTPGALKGITPQQAQVAKMLGPERGSLLLSQLMRPKEPPKPTAMMRNFQDAQANPAFAKFLERRRPTTNVNVNAAGAKAVQKGLGERYLAAEDAAVDAAAQARLYQTIDQLLDNPETYTGTGGELASSFKKAASTLLGVDVAGLGAEQAARKITDELALGFKKQAADPQTSNYERKIYERMSVGLNDSAEGRKLTVELRLSDLKNKQNQAQIWRSHIKPDGSVDPRVYESLAAAEAERRSELSKFLQKAQKIAGGAHQSQIGAGLIKRATNPATGEVIELRNGRWVPAK